MQGNCAAQVRLNCFCCGQSFAFGTNAYHGRYVPQYRISVCSVCYQANWDGWAPHLESRIREHADAEGLVLPPRNTKGWLPRD